MSLEANKELVKNFYQSIVVRGEFDKIPLYMGENYTQHSILAANGVEGLKQFVSEHRAKYPDTRLEFKRVIAEGDLVVTHSHAVFYEGHQGSAVIDIFRVEDDKVVEHWEVFQDIPERTLSGNSVF
ncbi:hypothetical protein E6B08_17770 [Pseudomonas putida]|uniref:SnoaL-like domain-containing protein n=1 Tax=Pseudomonas putida TaxID=303 RepID=A0A4D6X8V7_PSEPU|nr:ester cyclase [Pseudomonas putida]QCI13106.1 hypothetical protein E6B08_17770 [Pseudomonas putida]